MTEPRSYPATPAYGAPSGGQRPRPAPAGGPIESRSDGGRRPRSTPWLAVGLGLSFNLVSLLGVTVLGWPAGNVFLLFWAENAVLGVFTLVKVATASAPSPPGSLRVNGRVTEGSPRLYALFFTFHYGLFCLVHLVFTAIVAYKIGFELSFLFIGLPVILIAFRYLVETMTTWFGPGGQRATTSPSRAMGQPYPRILVLHFAVIVGFGLVIAGPDADGWVGTARRILAPLLAALPEGWQTQGVLLVLVLLAIKTVVDVFTTFGATRIR
jgi:hypothetical protein